MVMWVAFAINFWLAYEAAKPPGLLALGVAGLTASTARIAVTVRYRDQALTAALDRTAAHRLEVLFSIPYLAFSALLGVLSLHAFLWSSPEIHMLTICVDVGYCAGVATNCSLRPRLAIPSMVIAVGPPILAAATRGDAAYLGVAIIASAFLAAGIRSIHVRYETSKTEIGRRLSSISLARRDVLTTLPNRLALQEYFDENAPLISSKRWIAVHYLDLDGFKPVNDRHGHAVGDALLQAVADRLRGAVRSGDMVARMGGDEFAVIQPGILHADEAKLLARRIAATIAQPFTLDGHRLSISTCVGTAVSSDRSPNLESLLKESDTALYETKRRRPVTGMAMSA
ncbi:diguanylate cyclase [Novosphingobium malaysiense]|uniref:Diguanylate cyclase n=1 Tax=Novosphingobium malaysiense TaxID=1348853 RepID=A0A0B1ZMN6_9SPHN|nr:diguanylate cyclase [Novosphingobium malaysiense]